MNLVNRIGACAAIAALSVSLAYAAPGKPTVKTTTSPKCPLCKDSLVTKKDTMHPMAVKVNGKTFYACSRGAAAMKKTASAAKGVASMKSGMECGNCPMHSKGHKAN